ncbi:hypothetical protein E9531_06485 [Lampropedia puyangensis]|uniref:Lipoprotein n=1 Tax=Lampropedia puyangensis TaxID=1330072 RepID=A0A4S8F6N4_9BURK|nr:hypothetical protein [Lampropedia puyangensis]THU02747.1 hypothetical protein E9531_06485 [Lampropedia puyangensis]
MHQRVFRTTALCLAVAGLVGCGSSAIPLSKNFDQTSQYKVRSAKHWSTISADATNRTVAALEAAGATQSTPLYVALPENASSFDWAFRDMLTTALVDSGATVQAHPVAGQYTVVYHTQVVRHPSNLWVTGHGGRDYYNLGDGVTVRHGAHNIESVPLHQGYGHPELSTYSAQTGTELVLTTAVLHQDRFISRTTDVYYLENVDAGLFGVDNGNSLKSVNLKVVNQ